jgi:hypothetical protein
MPRRALRRHGITSISPTFATTPDLHAIRRSALLAAAVLLPGVLAWSGLHACDRIAVAV